MTIADCRRSQDKNWKSLQATRLRTLEKRTVDILYAFLRRSKELCHEDSLKERAITQLSSSRCVHLSVIASERLIDVSINRLMFGLRIEKTAYSESSFASNCILYPCIMKVNVDLFICIAWHRQIARVPSFQLPTIPYWTMFQVLGQTVVCEVSLVREANSQTMMVTLNGCSERQRILSENSTRMI